MLDEVANELDALLNTEFHKRLLMALLKSLDDDSNPLSFNSFCAGFRELVRHVLSEMAPDVEIKACSWYVPDATSKSGITRAHAITYVVQGGLSREYVVDVLDIDISEEKKKLVAAVGQLNKYTHFDETSFGISHVTAIKKAELAIQALAKVLYLSNFCRSELAKALEGQIQNEVVALAISETIGSIDELATHHSIDEIYVDAVDVTKVSSKLIHLQASGTIGVQLQWGSNSDLRRGDGAILDDSLPFTCQLKSSVDFPDEIEIIDDALCVDTSSWWDEYYDET